MKQIRKILGMKVSDQHSCIHLLVKDYLDPLAEHPLELEQLTSMNDQTLTVHSGLETLLTTWLENNVKKMSLRHTTQRFLHYHT